MFFKLTDKLSKFFLKTKKTLNVKIEHRYKGFSILLPAEHMLPTYQKQHPKYDRFLPHLASYISAEATIIDVGANCGDTLAGMVEQNRESKYVCIEPDDGFFTDLISNIERIRSNVPHLKVDAIKSLVGKNITDVSLEGIGGTKHAVVGNGTQTSKSLDKILEDLSLHPVELLKTDIDGFDYDAIESAQNLLISQQPILFFECEYDFDYQKAGYEKTMNWLTTVGYADWTMFDNFGEVLLRTKDVDHLFQLMEYVWKQNTNEATRTIYYFDVLAASDKDKQLIDDVLRTY